MKNLVKNVLVYLILHVSCYATIEMPLAEPQLLSSVISYLNLYERPITVLEIVKDKPHYTPALSQRKNTICICLVLDSKSAYKTVSWIEETQTSNVVVLNPRSIDASTFDTMSRCEHFDAVIINPDIATDVWHSSFSFLLELGDTIFFHTPWEDMNLFKQDYTKDILSYAAGKTGVLSAFMGSKRGIDIARWTQNKARSAEPRYEIRSNFKEKVLVKNYGEFPWTPGINLVTFIMCYGLYPTDELIRENMKAITRVMPEHNDYILGNNIVQGKSLVAIDGNDPRRSANLQRLLHFALEFFKDGNKRMRNPRRELTAYHQKLRKV